MTTLKKHSKYKNTGILFELLVRQVTADMMSNRESKAVKIIKKYFTGSELLKEYNLYNAILKAPKLTEGKAESLINTVIQESKKLDTTLLSKEKYNLIKEIKKHYNVEDFFRAKVSNYKASAAIYTLFEAARAKSLANTENLITNKITILEHITQEKVNNSQVERKVVEDFLKEDKEIRILAYRLIVEKYNETYSELSADQKELLKEYINNVSDTQGLKRYVNKKIVEVREELKRLLPTVKNEVVEIKLTEVIKLAKPLSERQSIKDEHLLSLLQYMELIKELKSN